MRLPVVVAILSFPLLTVAQQPAAPSPGAIADQAAAVAQAAQQDWRFAHPGATIIGGLRLKALLNSPLMSALMKEAMATDPNAAAMIGMMQGALSGVEEVRYSVLDIEELTGDLAGGLGAGPGTVEDNPAADPAGAEPEAAATPPDSLLLITGQLDESLVSAFSPDGSWELRRLGPDTLLLGTATSLDGAVQRMNQPTGGLTSRALLETASLASSHDLWLAGDLPELPVGEQLGTEMDLRGAALGITIGDDLNLELALTTASAEQAEELVRQARQAAALQPEYADMLQSSASSSTARFQVTVPGDLLMLLVQQGPAALPGLGELFGGPAGAEEPPPGGQQ